MVGPFAGHLRQKWDNYFGYTNFCSNFQKRKILSNANCEHDEALFKSKLNGSSHSGEEDIFGLAQHPTWSKLTQLDVSQNKTRNFRFFPKTY